MASEHVLKCWPEPFWAICEEIKRHEFRRNDRGFEFGDTLRLKEWDPVKEKYLGNEALVRVTYISRGPECGIPDGFAVMSIRLISMSGQESSESHEVRP